MSSIFGTQLTPQELQQLANYPALQAPEGVTSNFTDALNHGKPQIVAVSFLLSITAIFVLNRIYMKSLIVRRYKLDDRKSSGQSDNGAKS